MVMYETFISLLRNIKRNTIVHIINIMDGIFIGLQQCRISVKVLYQEIVEVRNEYGITLKPIKPKRKIDPWDYEKESKVSGWKMQSKRRKQWR